MRISDWSSDVCSSDLNAEELLFRAIKEVDSPDGADARRVIDQLALALLGDAVELEHVRNADIALDIGEGAPELVSGAIAQDDQITTPGDRRRRGFFLFRGCGAADWYLRSEEHTSELQSLMAISYA